jgi:predicted transcriptional regulator
MDKNIAVQAKIATAIREQRRKLEISQESLGFAIKRSKQFVSDLELGKTSLPAELIPVVVEKLRFKSVSEFWQKVQAVEFAQSEWSD